MGFAALQSNTAALIQRAVVFDSLPSRSASMWGFFRDDDLPPPLELQGRSRPLSSQNVNRSTFHSP